MDKINDILTRGVENIISNREELEKLLQSGKKLNVYNGADPTAIHLHIGNAVPLRKLQQLVELGHNVTFLVGNFTALIGDNSDKESERPQLTREQIEINFADYKKQAQKILDFSKVRIVYNGDWLKKLTFKDVIELCRHFSVGDFVSRELIKKRMTAGERVRLDELLYPVMQGYDSYYLDTDIQLGGTDQTFNMQAGRTLQKDLRNKESFIIANNFLEGTDGRKMSKSWGNAIWLDDSPDDMYGKTMSIKDDLIVRYFELATNLPMAEISKLESRLKSGENPMTLKKELAFQIVSELHSNEDAQKAQESFETTFQKGDPSSADIPTFSVPTTDLQIEELLVTTKLVDSRSEAKRLVEQNAVEINDETKKSREVVKIKSGDIIKVGKRKFLKFVWTFSKNTNGLWKS